MVASHTFTRCFFFRRLQVADGCLNPAVSAKKKIYNQEDSTTVAYINSQSHTFAIIFRRTQQTGLRSSI